jgi:hypothetical protein
LSLGSVSTLSAGLNALASGDLTGRLDGAFSADFEGLRTNLSATVASLNQMVAAVSGITAAIKSSIVEIAQGAGALARRTEQQAANLEETAASLDEITAKVKKTSDGAHRVSAIVASAKSDAARSSDVVESAVSAMGEIEMSSSQIGQIIGVIDAIAFQTNLLALNAGVEAARAGRRSRLCRRRLRGSGSGPAFRRRGEEDQGPGVDLNTTSQPWRWDRRRGRCGPGAYHRPDRRDKCRGVGDSRIGAGTGGEPQSD